MFFLSLQVGSVWEAISTLCQNLRCVLSNCVLSNRFVLLCTFDSHKTTYFFFYILASPLLCKKSYTSKCLVQGSGLRSVSKMLSCPQYEPAHLYIKIHVFRSLICFLYIIEVIKTFHKLSFCFTKPAYFKLTSHKCYSMMINHQNMSLVQAVFVVLLNTYQTRLYRYYTFD